MDNFQQNFDQNLGGGAYQYGASRSRIASFIALSMLIGSLLGTGGMWVWHYQTAASLEVTQGDLVNARKNYSKADVDMLMRNKESLDRARTLLSTHTVPSSIIDFLADHTEATVVWTDMAYKRGSPADKDRQDSLTLNGVADQYPGLLRQMAHFRDRSQVSSMIVNTVELQNYAFDDKTRLVAFSVKLTLNPSYVEFSKVIERQPMSQPKPTSIESPATPVSPADGIPAVVEPPVVAPITETPRSTRTVQASSTKAAPTAPVAPVQGTVATPPAQLGTSSNPVR